MLLLLLELTFVIIFLIYFGRFLTCLFFHWNSDETVPSNIIYLWKYYTARFLVEISTYFAFRKHTLRKPLSQYSDSLISTEREWALESPIDMKSKNDVAVDTVHFQGSDVNGNMLILRLTTHSQTFSELWLIVKYNNQVYTLPEHPQTVLAKYDNEFKTFVCKGVRLEVGEPFRGWRISINTYLRKGINTARLKDETNLVHVKLAGRWHPASEVYNFACDTNSSLTAKGFAQNNWNGQFFKSISNIKSYSTNQWGQVTAQISIGATVANEELNLLCLKSRYFGNVSWKYFDKITTVVANFRNGTYLHIGNSDIYGVKNFLYGYLVLPSGEIVNVTEWDILKSKNKNYSEYHDAEKYPIKFSAGDTEYLLHVTVEDQLPLIAGENDLNLNMKLCTLNLNGKLGYGSVTFGQKTTCSQQQGVLWSIKQKESIEIYSCSSEELSLSVVPLTHRAAKCCSLTGGKGCNLAQIMTLEKSFTVPSGICITTTAYSNHIRHYSELKRLTNSLEEYGKLSNVQLETTCEKIVQLLTNSELLPELVGDIESELVRLYGKKFETNSFAVRSSALGEDSSELSTAGQLETFLKIKGLKSICENIKKCWASQFKPEAVQYLRQHGQSLTQSMAVVIQEMIESEVSGVLFTNDPVAEDSGLIIINAYPGLGELVVSGSVTPDTVVLRRSYFTHECFVERIDVGELEIKQTCCISNEIAVKLGDIGVMLELAFGKPKDVEWTVKNNRIYILQARDITSLHLESHYELLHEFDSATVSEEDCYTTANVGEVMPFPNCPLTIAVSGHAVEKGSELQRSLAEARTYMKHNYTTHLGIIYRNRFFINLLSCIYQDCAYWSDTRLLEVVFMGHVLEDKRVKRFARNRYPKPTPKQQFYGMSKMFKILLYDLRVMLEPYTKRFEKYTLPPFPTTCENLYADITNHFKDLCDVWYLHILSSIRTSFSYTVVAGTILPRNSEWTADHFSDISLLYSSCSNVVSADVPSALKNLARMLSKSGKATHFRTLEPEEALKWLKSKDAGNIAEEFNKFIVKHGHRTIAEIDLSAKSWETDPLPLITVLQSMLQDESSLWYEKGDVSIEDALNGLHQQLSKGKRWFLTKMVPVARSSVVAREHTKNLGIKVVDGFRKAYIRLGRMLCDKGYLPDPDLIFFLLHTEIGDVIKFRSAKLVAKAVRRRKIVPLQADLHYPELMIGQPKPLEEHEREDIFKGIKANVEIRGTPVSKGKAKGRARVAVTLKDAKETKLGEILVARSTDIGWSPYFPLLAGVVTELGGLLSHGAVVAREYGLPCIVGAQRATNLIKTGDLVLLDASKGILMKLED